MKRRLLITGSNRGTGRAIAKVFYEAGYQIASLNRTLSGEEWLGEIQCDLTNTARLSIACNEALASLGGVDVCILNAAVRRFSYIEQMTDKDWNESLATNLSSIFFTTRQLIPALRETRGVLVIMGSHAGTHYFEEGVAYCVTKAALKAFAEVMTMETRSQGIRTMLVSPGAIRNRSKSDDDKKIQPETIGEIIYALVHCGADAIVGEVEIRPSNPLPSPILGIERLQSI